MYSCRPAPAATIAELRMLEATRSSTSFAKERVAWTTTLVISFHHLFRRKTFQKQPSKATYLEKGSKAPLAFPFRPARPHIRPSGALGYHDKRRQSILLTKHDLNDDLWSLGRWRTSRRPEVRPGCTRQTNISVKAAGQQTISAGRSDSVMPRCSFLITSQVVRPLVVRPLMVRTYLGRYSK